MNPCVIFNPVARGDKARQFQQHLAGLSHQCALKPTTAAGAGRALAAEAVREGFDTIIAAGGDGTVNEVLNGLGDVPDAFARVRLGVLPLGTVNVFAKELGLPVDFLNAWRVICAGRERRIDLPTAEHTLDGKTVRRHFAQLAGAGLDSRAIELVNWEHKKKIGPLAYVAAGFRALAGKLPQLTVTNGVDTATGELVLIGNGRFYGGRIAVFPGADLEDGQLEVVVWPRANVVALLQFGWGWLTNQLHRAGNVRRFRGDNIRLTSSAPHPFELDGENIGPLPVTFTVQRRALRVIVPHGGSD